MQKSINEFSDKRARRDFILTVIALVTFANPCVNAIDVLPDFIGCFILVSVFRGASFVAPYFSEARVWLKRLAIVSLLKLPALAAVVAIRAQNTQDNDVIALVAVVFLALDLICALPAINNSFSALFYLGERTEATALIKPRGRQTPEGLKSFTVLFFILRATLSTLPEFLRLTRAVELEGTATVVRASSFYPFAVLAAVAVTLAVGTVWLVKGIRYLLAVKSEGNFYLALSSLAEENSLDELKRRLTLDKKKRIGVLLVLTSLLSFEFGLGEHGDANLIPHTLGGVALLIALISLFRLCEARRSVKICAVIAPVAFCVTSLTAYALTLSFADSYGYSSLSKGVVNAAERLYSVITVLSAVEFVLYLATVAVLGLLLFSYIDKFVLIGKDTLTLSVVDRDRRRNLRIKSLVLVLLLSAVALGRFLQVIFKGARISVSTGGSLEHMSIINSQTAPWFTAVLALITAILTVYSIYFVGVLRDEERV